MYTISLIQNHGVPDLKSCHDSSLIQNNIKQAVLTRFNRKLLFEQTKVILFLDDTACHQELTAVYSLDMDRPGCFFKALPDKA